jgi:hypothetical protein
MTKFDVKKLRGLKDLLQDAVVNGATSIEEVHKRTAARPFNILGEIPGVADVSEAVRAVHDAIVTTSYAATRAVTEVVGAGLDAALDVVDDASSATETSTATPEEGTDPKSADAAQGE